MMTLFSVFLHRHSKGNYSNLEML